MQSREGRGERQGCQDLLKQFDPDLKALPLAAGVGQLIARLGRHRQAIARRAAGGR